MRGLEIVPESAKFLIFLCIDQKFKLGFVFDHTNEVILELFWLKPVLTNMIADKISPNQNMSHKNLLKCIVFSLALMFSTEKNA